MSEETNFESIVLQPRRALKEDSDDVAEDSPTLTHTAHDTWHTHMSRRRPDDTVDDAEETGSRATEEEIAGLIARGKKHKIERRILGLGTTYKVAKAVTISPVKTVFNWVKAGAEGLIHFNHMVRRKCNFSHSRVAQSNENIEIKSRFFAMKLQFFNHEIAIVLHHSVNKCRF